MMKRFLTIVVMLSLLCTCFVGCAKEEAGDIVNESASNTLETFESNEEETYSSTSVSLDETDTTAIDVEETHSYAPDIDNRNPVLGIDGMYTYNIRGHEIKLSINIWDYSGKPEHENLLLLKAITEHYGFTEKVNLNGVYYNPTTGVSAGLQHHGDGNTTSVVAVFGGVHRAAINYSAYIADHMDLYYIVSDRPLSLEFAIILAYAMEQTNVNPEANPFEFLNEYRESADSYAYFLDCPPIN